MMTTRNVVFGFLSGLIGAGVGNYLFQAKPVSAQQPFITFDRPIQIADKNGNRWIEVGPQGIKIMQRQGPSSPTDTTFYGFDSLKISPGGSAFVGSIELVVDPKTGPRLHLRHPLDKATVMLTPDVINFSANARLLHCYPQMDKCAW